MVNGNGGTSSVKQNFIIVRTARTQRWSAANSTVRGGLSLCWHLLQLKTIASQQWTIALGCLAPIL